jgi:hypothetical protein
MSGNYWYVYQGSQDSSSASGGQTLGSLSVGSTVKLNVNGVGTTFIVIHQGSPSSDYYNCDGTWLLMEEAYTTGQWNNSSNGADNIYSISTVHNYLNSTFLNLLDASARNIIKQVRIPYTSSSVDETVATGSNGLSTKIFLLSVEEVEGVGSMAVCAEGSRLSYFSSGSSSTRIAKSGSSHVSWWTRSPRQGGFSNVFYYNTSGISAVGGMAGTFAYYRPALILPSTLTTSSDGTVITNTAPTTPGVPSLPSRIKGGSTVNVSWSTSSDEDGNLSGYRLEVSLDGGSWTSIYTGSSTSAIYAVPEGTETIAFRVRAYDSVNASSPYATSATASVINVPVSLNGNVTIDGLLKALTGEGYANIDGIWKELVKTYVNIDGIWKDAYQILYTWGKYNVNTITTYNKGFG